MNDSEHGRIARAGARLGLGIALATGIAAGAHAAESAAPGAATGIVGVQQPSRAELFRALLQLRGEDLDGRVWTHERLQGRIVLVDFWATWCAPCREELPFLKRARMRYGDDFAILGISLDTLDRGTLRGWLQRQGVDWPQIPQRRGFDDRIPRAFGIYRLPANLLLDRQGRLRAVDVRGPRLFEQVDSLLAEERQAS